MRLLLFAAALAAGSVARPARAAQKSAPPSPLERGAYVLRIDGRDLYFDLGRTTGAAEGERVRVFRVVSALHPISGAVMRDRFLVAEIEIAEVGEVLSRARPEPEVARLIKVGDGIELASTAASTKLLVQFEEPAQAPVPANPTAPQHTTQDDEALQFQAAFARAQELSPPVRALHWEHWLKDHPGSTVGPALLREVEQLRAPPVTVAALAESKPVPEPAEGVLSAPEHASAGLPVEFVLTFPEGAALLPRAAELNWRPRGSALYQTLLFSADDSQYWRARLPPEAARSPGVDYYLAEIDSLGAERPTEGDGSSPRALEVDRIPGLDQAVKKERSRAGLWVDVADWNHFKGSDWHYNVEGEFLYRTLSAIHSVRMGFGVYQGVGESLSQEIKDERAAGSGAVHYRSRRVGYNYGFTELEFQPFELLGVIFKGLTGVDHDGFQAGFEGRVRIGHEDGTNLLLSSGFTRKIGNKNEITLSWDRVPGFPMSASVIVTNEPVQADYGVRFVYQVGRRLADFIDVSLRLGYQLRDINHNGFGIGVAESFHW